MGDCVMIILKIFGWALVVYLFGSLIYSVTFHLGNYHRSKVNNSEIGSKLWDGFLNRILIMQLIKLLIAGFIISLLIK